MGICLFYQGKYILPLYLVFYFTNISMEMTIYQSLFFEVFEAMEYNRLKQYFTSKNQSMRFVNR